MSLPDAVKLIQSQLSLVMQLQSHADEAISRNDWQNVDRITNTIHTAFETFLEGIQVMAIDVSNLKNILTTGAVSPDAIKSLQEKLEVQAKDLEEVKAALKELNDAAAPVPLPPAL